MKKLFVTKPSLPELKEFLPYLERIWSSKILTNMGEFHEEFERKLEKYLGVKHVTLFCNGTVALQVGLHALNLTGEIITTPFTFAATAHAIFWNRCTPVFADIDPETLNIDPVSIRKVISPKTSAILPVHVFGRPCENEKITNIAKEFNLKVLYDAAHSFAVTKNNESILNWGDISMVSFHATKAFNTIEGGALITQCSALDKRLKQIRNFGYESETLISEPGINGKMNEIQSALGILQLKKFKEFQLKREQIHNYYRHQIDNLLGLKTLSILPETTNNYSYFPILISASLLGETRDELVERLSKKGIYCRKYFYPLLTSILEYQKCKKDNLKIAEKVSENIVCLPISSEMEINDAKKVIKCIKDKD